MLASVLALALLLAPYQQTAAWGDHEWRNGVGMLSAYYFQNRTGFASGYALANGTRAGSFYHLLAATGAGSAYFWSNGTAAGSAYFWRNGVEPGSRYYWDNGRGCLSAFGWRNGAACDGEQILTFQSLCIAEVIDIAPCQAINARLEDWLERSSSSWTADPAAAVARMREAVD